MNNKIKGVAAVAAAAAIAASLTGCLTVNVQQPAPDDNQNTNTQQPDNNSNKTESNTNTDSKNETNSNTNSNDSNSNTSNSNKENTSNKNKTQNANTSNSNKSNSNTSNSNSTDNPLAKELEVGNNYVGHIKAPSDWKDRTSSDINERIVDDQGTVYIVDPTTEYTSGVLSHFDFTASVRLDAFPTSYTNKADEILYDLRGDSENYSDVNIQKDKFNGLDASTITCTSADGVDIRYIVFDKNGDGNSCVVATANSTSSTDKTVTKILQSWTA